MSYAFEWLPGPVLLASVIVFPFVPGLVLIGLVAVAVAALVALAGAILATPYVLVRTLHQHRPARRESTEASMPLATAIPQVHPS